MQLLLNHPLWIVVIVVTILLHVGFFIAIRRVMRRSSEQEHGSEAPESTSGDNRD